MRRSATRPRRCRAVARGDVFRRRRRAHDRGAAGGIPSLSLFTDADDAELRRVDHEAREVMRLDGLLRTRDAELRDFVRHSRELEAMVAHRDERIAASDAREASFASSSLAHRDRLQKEIDAQERIIAYRASGRWWLKLPWIRARRLWTGFARHDRCTSTQRVDIVVPIYNAPTTCGAASQRDVAHAGAPPADPDRRWIDRCRRRDVLRKFEQRGDRTIEILRNERNVGFTARPIAACRIRSAMSCCSTPTRSSRRLACPRCIAVPHRTR
jgi:hypothetical protein